MMFSWPAFFCWMKRISDFINNRRGRTNRLAVALLIGCVRFLGTWPHNLSSIPANVQWFVARQLGISDIGVISEYSKRETTLREHQALVRRAVSAIVILPGRGPSD
ncbi:DUF4158 domain-containing protein [Providencia hangzhouensis]|uniref:DUF4158 domain-containing protein n=1 Tax=Providencia hangzhouensis TaxID=3031799 RepID=UPI003979E05F